MASGDEHVPGKELGPLHGRRLGEFEVRIHDEPRHPQMAEKVRPYRTRSPSIQLIFGKVLSPYLVLVTNLVI